MSRGVGFRYRGACEGGANPLSELDHALTMIGSAHWTENFSTSAHPRNRRRSTSLNWQLWGIKTNSYRQAERRLCVRSRDLRRDAMRRGRSAASGPSSHHTGPGRFDLQRSFADPF